MTGAMNLIRELKARTKAPCVNPDCQDGTHWCSFSGDWNSVLSCCEGCRTVSEAFRHLNNLRIEYFERAVEALVSRVDKCYCDKREGCPHDVSARVLAAIEEDAKKALEGK